MIYLLHQYQGAQIAALYVFFFFFLIYLPSLIMNSKVYEQWYHNFRAPNCGNLAFLPAASDFKVAQFLSSNHTPNILIWVFFSRKIIKITQLGRKKHKIVDFHVKWIIDIDYSPGHLNLWNWWKECSWPLKKLENSLNGQETVKFEEKRAAAGRWMKSSPILGHPPNSFLTCGRQFQSRPIQRGKPGHCNTFMSF